MKYSTVLTTFASFGIAIISFGQEKNGKISGAIVAEKHAVESATISVLNAKDSSIVKMSTSDKLGYFTVGNLAGGKYLLHITSVSYQQAYTAVFNLTSEKQNLTIPTITLNVKGNDLKEVIVTVKKPLIEQKLDKTLVNVDASPSNTGLSAMEVLEKSPGVSVDKDGNISLKGKQGVLILIDGKPSYLSGPDLANMLRNMSSAQLEQIEIMTNPPAKYDAAGNSGVINIKTKKSKVRGFNGSVAVGGGQGVYSKANSSINLNYRSGKWNVFANYGYNYRKSFNDLTLVRNFRDANTLNLLSVFNQNASSYGESQFQSLKLGADFYATKNTTLGIVVNSFINPHTSNMNTTSLIMDNMGQLTSQTLGTSVENDNWKNLSTNLNLRHQFDSTGTEITADLDYVGYKSSNTQDYNNVFYDNHGNKMQPNETSTNNKPSTINIFSAKTDFTKQLNKSTKLEAGAKISYVKTDNNAMFQNLFNGQWQIDAGRTNHFAYTENINAAYINTTQDFTKKWSGQLGLRVENTNAKGNQITTGENFDRHYTQVFPTAYVGYKANNNNQFAISYGRRIDRPSYQDLNPFTDMLDKYTYQVGNPYLLPQMSRNLELTHTFKGIITSTLSYSNTNDMISDVISQVDSTHTTFVKKDNFASQKVVGLSVSVGLPITKWWHMNFYTNVYNKQISTQLNGSNFNLDGTSLTFNSTSQFTFKKGWGAEVSGWFDGKGVDGTIVRESMGTINMAFSKQVFNNQGSFRLNLQDPFNLNMFHGYSKYQNIDLTISNRWDNRVVNLSFTYRFGKPINGTKQRKNGGAEDEQNRVKAGN